LVVYGKIFTTNHKNECFKAYSEKLGIRQFYVRPKGHLNQVKMVNKASLKGVRSI